MALRDFDHEASAQTRTLVLLIAAIAGLAAIPIMPWVMFEPEEGDTHYWDSGAFDKSISSPSSLQDLQDDLSWINITYWLVLIFASLGIIGLSIYRIHFLQPAAKGLVFTAMFAIIFTVINLVCHILFIFHVEDLESSSFPGNVNLIFFNFLSIALSILVLFVSLALVKVVVNWAKQWYHRYLWKVSRVPPYPPMGQYPPRMPGY